MYVHLVFVRLLKTQTINLYKQKRDGLMYKLGLVSGDGLPISGLLTVFRNVVEVGLKNGLLHPAVPSELGYSWRPDKEHFFPCGRADSNYPKWMIVSDAVPMSMKREDLIRELDEIRFAVANEDCLSTAERKELKQRIERIALPYEDYFFDWFNHHNIDWVCALT